MQNRLSKAQLSTLVAGVCQELGNGWAVVTCDLEHVVKIRDGEGHGLIFNSQWEGPGRIAINGDYPRDSKNYCYGRAVIPYNASLPRISVTDTKTGKQIAGDVTRRFLPEYMGIYTKAVERKAASDKFEAEQSGVIDRLAEVAPSLHVNRESKEFSDYRSEGGYVTKGQASNDSVSMDLRSIPVEKALEILKLLHA